MEKAKASAIRKVDSSYRKFKERYQLDLQPELVDGKGQASKDMILFAEGHEDRFLKVATRGRNN